MVFIPSGQQQKIPGMPLAAKIHTVCCWTILLYCLIGGFNVRGTQKSKRSVPELTRTLVPLLQFATDPFTNTLRSVGVYLCKYLKVFNYLTHIKIKHFGLDPVRHTKSLQEPHSGAGGGP
jgi:hypothetical protein